MKKEPSYGIIRKTIGVLFLLSVHLGHNILLLCFSSLSSHTVDVPFEIARGD